MSLNHTIKNIGLAIIQFAVFGTIAYLIYQKFSFSDFSSSIRSADISYILLGAFLILVNELILGIRWWVTSVALRIDQSISYFIKNTIIIRFLDYLFPIPAAEEFYKVVILKLNGTEMSKSIASALFDKILGLMLLMVILPFSLVLLLKKEILIQTDFVAIIFVCVIFISLMVFILLKPRTIMSMIIFVLERIPIKRISNIKIDRSSIQYDFAKLPIHIFLIMLNLLIQALAILSLFFAFDLTVNLLMIVFLLPFMILSKVLPISYQGMGLYEASMVFFMGLTLSLPENITMSVSILHLGIFTTFHLLGGIVFLQSDLRSQVLAAIRRT